MRHLITYNESVRDKMTPKSDDDVIKAFIGLSLDDKKHMMMKLSHERFKSKEEFCEFVKKRLGLNSWRRLTKNIDEILTYSIVDNMKNDDLVFLLKSIVYLTTPLKESLRDKMTPKSEDDILKSLEGKSMDNLLMRGVMKNQMWLVKHALDNGANIHTGYMENMKRPDNDSPLLWAIEEGNVPMVKYLISRGADVNAGNGEPLTTAVGVVLSKKKTFQIIDILISAGADIHANNNAAYKTAKMYGEADIMDHLKAYESVRDKMTPKSKEDISKGLIGRLSRNKYLGQFNPEEWGLTMIDYDTSGGLNDHIVVVLKSEDDRRWQITVDDREYFPIIVREKKRGVAGVACRDYKCVEKYLEKKGLTKRVNEGVRDKMVGKSDRYEEWTETPEGIVERFEKEFDVKTTDWSKDIFGDLYEIVLLESPEAEEIKQWFLTNTDYKVIEIHLSILGTSIAVEKNIKLDESVRDRMTPKSEEDIKNTIKSLQPQRKLMVGIENDMLWAVKEATEEGGRDILHQDLELEPSEDAYESPVVYAVEMGRTEIALYMIDSGYDLHTDNNKVMKTAVRLGNLKIIDKLIEKDYHPLTKEVGLLSSVVRSNIYLAKMFLDLGADVHYKNDVSLVNALGRQNDEMVELLLSRGADLYKAEQSCTPKGKEYAKKFYKPSLFQKLRNFKGFRTNEGLRDKMTPKPTDEIRKGMRKYFQENLVTNPTEYVRDTGVYEPKEKIYLIFDWEDYWGEVDGYFRKLIEGPQEMFQMAIYDDTYQCYPKHKIVDYTDNTLTGGWYFSKDHIEGIIDYVIKNG